MKVLVQWTLNNPADWEEIDSSEWGNTPYLAEPSNETSPVTFDTKGWIFALNVQGIIFKGYDHYAVEELKDGSSGIKVFAWLDDPVDFSFEDFSGVVASFLPIAPDKSLGNALNTRQFIVRYGKNGTYPFFEFPYPVQFLWRHGVTVPDSLVDTYEKNVSLLGWRDWTQNLDPSELDEKGKIKTQRDLGRWSKAKGTITYYQRDTNLATGVHVDANENEMNRNTATSATESATISNSAGATPWSITTPSNEPNDANWPNGTYRFQFDCTAAGADIRYAIGITDFNLNGHFGRVDSGLTSDLETNTQGEGEFSGTGLKLATVSWNPSAGAAGDRFECRVSVSNLAGGHGSQSITLRFNTTDSFADGPWPDGVSERHKNADTFRGRIKVVPYGQKGGIAQS